MSSPMQKELEKVSALNAEVDATKGQTLAEISRIVTDIQQQVKEMKTKMAPQIKDLRAIRANYAEQEKDYLKAKSTYLTLKSSLQSEQKKFEQECEDLQAECLDEESRFHVLRAEVEMSRHKLERIKKEGQYQKGEGSLLRDIASWKDLYKSKISQQEQLAKQLRAQKRHIEENEGSNVQQREMFKVIDLVLFDHPSSRLRSTSTGIKESSADEAKVQEG